MVTLKCEMMAKANVERLCDISAKFSFVLCFHVSYVCKVLSPFSKYLSLISHMRSNLRATGRSPRTPFLSSKRNNDDF